MIRLNPCAKCGCASVTMASNPTEITSKTEWRIRCVRCGFTVVAIASCEDERNLIWNHYNPKEENNHGL